ncbi:EVE domain-containing protein [Stutzerimonas urumqiensis]|uniref:EVE domain-containing protein n=1 Tax=Stutzerimonas urumqiensis TaxID=638269 RepID=UPI003DA5AD2F
MPYWLMKSEPDEFSIQDLASNASARWDGVRNFQARNYLREMKIGDLFFFYHSSCAIPGVAGIGRVVAEAYADPMALAPDSPYFDAKASVERNPWSAVDVEHVATFERVLPLTTLKTDAGLTGLALVQKGSRLSVMPVAPDEWATILRIANERLPD